MTNTIQLFNPNHPLTPIIKGMLSRINRNYKNEADIKWNFTKFLIDRQGNVVKRFEPTEDIKVIEEKCKGITCGRRATSCADQLACAVREAYEASVK